MSGAPGDVSPPTVTITSPTSGPTHATATTPISLAGTCTDNTACTVVTWACSTCTPTSGTASGTASWTISSIGLASGANVNTSLLLFAAASAPVTVIWLRRRLMTLASVDQVMKDESAYQIRVSRAKSIDDRVDVLDAALMADLLMA